MEVSARLSSKGQVTVPRDVREALSLEEGDRVLSGLRDSARYLRGRLIACHGRVRARAGREAWDALGTGPAPDASGTRRSQAVTAFVDTNVLIRHLTGDPPAQAAKATWYLQRGDELLLPDLILAEVAYVLESFYESPRRQVADTLRAVLAFPAVPSSMTSCCSGLWSSTSCIGSTPPMPTW